MFDALTFVRYFVAGVAGAMAAYTLCWWFLAGKSAAGMNPWEALWSPQLRQGRTGLVRSYIAGVVAFTTYGLIATYDAPPFTYDWLHCAIFDGDWVVILVAPLILAYLPWRYSQHAEQQTA